MFIPKREDESVDEWIDRVRRMAPSFGYPASPEWWTKLFQTEQDDEQKKEQRDRDA